MTFTLEEMFSSGEGDHWYHRNKHLLGNPDVIKRDPVLRLIQQYGLKPARVLEIGCSNGWRLGEIQRRYGSDCVGVDVSEAAIKDGISRYPVVTFLRGRIDALPPPLDTTTEKFDLVIVHFVFHWVCREKRSCQ